LIWLLGASQGSISDTPPGPFNDSYGRSLEAFGRQPANKAQTLLLPYERGPPQGPRPCSESGGVRTVWGLRGVSIVNGNCPWGCGLSVGMRVSVHNQAPQESFGHHLCFNVARVSFLTHSGFWKSEDGNTFVNASVACRFNFKTIGEMHFWCSNFIVN
jgi:hypothetical protein